MAPAELVTLRARLEKKERQLETEQERHHKCQVQLTEVQIIVEQSVRECQMVRQGGSHSQGMETFSPACSTMLLRQLKNMMEKQEKWMLESERQRIVAENAQGVFNSCFYVRS